MNYAKLNTHMLPALLTGTNRASLSIADVFDAAIDPADPKAALKALCLTGQSLRFARPPRPTLSQTTTNALADRPFLPEHLRKPFRALTCGLQGENASLIAAAIARAMERCRIAPHPFDLEPARDFVVAHAVSLGTLAFEFAQRQKPETEQRAYFDWSALDDECWTEAAIAQRERFLRQRRQADPSAARRLLEAHWPTCNAEERFRLLACLRTGLSAADQDFLSGLIKDRAPRVRDAATAMLSRITQDGVFGKLNNLVERIEQVQAGLLRKRRSFRLKYPATLKEDGRLAWILDNFGQLGLEMIARALDCPPEGLVEAASKDEGLLFVLLLAAGNDKRFDLLDAIVQAWPDAWERLAATSFDGLPEYDTAERHRWIEIVVRPQNWTSETDWTCARRLLAICGDDPLPTTLFEALLRSSWAKSNLAGWEDTHCRAIELLALLCPPAQRPALLRQIPEDNEDTQPARWLLEFLNSLEAYSHE